MFLGGISGDPLVKDVQAFEALSPKPSLGQSHLALLSSANIPCFK